MEHIFPAKTESIKDIISLTSDALSHGEINKNLAYEYQLLIEEILLKLINCSKDDSKIEVEIFRRFGGTNIRLSCTGKEVVLEPEDEQDYGGKIIEQFRDYIKQSYVAGENNVIFASSKTKTNKSVFISILAVLFSAVFAFIIQSCLDPVQKDWVLRNIVSPPVLAFMRFMQTVATPVAFFALISSLITARLSIENDRKKAILVARYALTSVFALLLGALICFLYKSLGIFFQYKMTVVSTENFTGSNIKEFLEQAIPNNFIEPFVNSNPLPLLVMGVLLAYVVTNSFGPSGEFARKSLKALDGVFSKMLDFVYQLIPVFLFFALVQGWLETGAKYALIMAKNLLLFLPPFLLIYGLYALELALNGINPVSFIKEYKEIIIENFKIGSNIQAMPYNRRMIYKKTKMPLDALDSGLKLGAMMNMDGNGIIIATGITGIILAADLHFTVMHALVLILIAIFLSIGAPNQSGSYILCMTVLTAFVGISGDIFDEILVAEAFLGKLYSCTNSVGDIVTLVIENKKIKDAALKSER